MVLLGNGKLRLTFASTEVKRVKNEPGTPVEAFEGEDSSQQQSSQAGSPTSHHKRRFHIASTFAELSRTGTVVLKPFR